MNLHTKIVESYKISTHPEEIVEILNRGHALDLCMMWQTLSNHRQIFHFQTFELDLKDRMILIIYEGNKDQVDSKYPIFVKLAFREAVFKGKITEAKPNQVLLEIPDEVHLREFREHMRMALPRDQKFAEIRSTAESIAATLKIALRDITQLGLGLSVSEKNGHHFRVGQIIELRAFNDIKLTNPVKGRVVYSIQEDSVPLEPGQWLRVGIQMLAAIPGVDLKKLNQVAPPPQPRDLAKELLSTDVFSEEFQKMMESQIAKTVGKMKQRPSILKYLNQLEIARGQDAYMEEHINVLTIICTFMARSMNWVSDASLEKFIYASYLHDAPFFGHPKLARILDLRQFNLVKNELTSEERSIYLGAPEIASAIALADHQAPLDAAQMLLMQKELPNGEGFPNKLTLGKITPMAALFIVAHSLTDEIVTNPDWSMDAWLKEAKKTYKGGHYNKILEAIATVKVTLKRVKPT